MVSHRSNVCTQPRKTLSWESHTNHFSSSHSHVRFLFLFFSLFLFCCFIMLFVYRISNYFRCVFLCLFSFSLFRNFWMNLQCIPKMKSFFFDVFIRIHGLSWNDSKPYPRFCIAVSSETKKNSLMKFNLFCFNIQRKDPWRNSYKISRITIT